MRLTLHHFDGYGTICGGSGKQPSHADGDQWKLLLWELRLFNQLYLPRHLFGTRNLCSRTQLIRPSKLWILGRPHYRHRKLHVGQWCNRNQQNSVASNQSIPHRGTGDHDVYSFVSPPGQLQLKLSGTNIGGAASFYADINRHMATNHKNLYCTCFRNGYFKLDYTVRPTRNDWDRRYSFYIRMQAYDTVWISPKSENQILLDSSIIFGCDSVCFELENQLDTGGQLNYQWVLSDGTVDSSLTFSHCLSDSGDYYGYLLTTSSEGCTDSVTLPMIRVGHTRILDSLVIANDGSVFSGAVQVLNSSEVIGLGAHYEVVLSQGIDSIFISAGSQSWSDGNITGNQLAPGWSPVVLDAEPQTVCAFLYTSQGCVDSICQQIAFFPTVEVPNVFTPNSDGVNDELVLQTTSTERIKTTIYSRWGTKVFESSVLGEYWDGRFEGRPVAPGVYFLTVEVANPYAPSPITATATVHLLR